ncbi:MAG: hypothetical protein DME19_08385 [Verrucomicrobia bacterium]|nr:MAG: hypothetical protein DME19_08385 [Verrucomicrobiota bacterium]
MLGNIPESDWRHFKRVHQVLLERFCQRTLDDLGAMYELLVDRDEELARAFDDFRRSTAVIQLAIMRRMGLLSDDELSVFSEQTQKIVRGVDSLRSAGGAAPNGGPATPLGNSGVMEGSSVS